MNILSVDNGLLVLSSCKFAMRQMFILFVCKYTYKMVYASWVRILRIPHTGIFFLRFELAVQVYTDEEEEKQGTMGSLRYIRRKFRWHIPAKNVYLVFFLSRRG